MGYYGVEIKNKSVLDILNQELFGLKEIVESSHDKNNDVYYFAIRDKDSIAAHIVLCRYSDDEKLLEYKHFNEEDGPVASTQAARDILPYLTKTISKNAAEWRDRVVRGEWGFKINTILNDLRITQEEIAEATGVGRSTVSKYMRGLRVPDGGFIREFCAAYNVNPVWFILESSLVNENRYLTEKN